MEADSMTAVLLATAMINGTGTCNVVGQRAYGYVVQQRQNYAVQRQAVYAPAKINYANAYVAQAAYVPIQKVDYRASYVGFPVRSDEQAQQLLIIEQQSKALSRVNDRLIDQLDRRDDRIKELEVEKSNILQQGGGGQPQPAVDPGQPPPVPEPGRGQTPAPVIEMFKTKCAQCHGGEQGKANGWVMDLNKIARPSIALRLRVGDAINRPQNPMPKGGKLTDAERQAFNAWATFTKQELAEADK
jgi:mono/diheme cytochrome c family protein